MAALVAAEHVDEEGGEDDDHVGVSRQLGQAALGDHIGHLDGLGHKRVLVDPAR